MAEDVETLNLEFGNYLTVLLGEAGWQEPRIKISQDKVEFYINNIFFSSSFYRTGEGVLRICIERELDNGISGLSQKFRDKDSELEDSLGGVFIKDFPLYFGEHYLELDVAVREPVNEQKRMMEDIWIKIIKSLVKLN